MSNEYLFQNYVIRAKDNKCIAFHKTFTNRYKVFEGHDCQDQAKDWIYEYVEKTMSWDDIDQTCLSFNVDFLREIMGEEEFFSFDLDLENNSTIITLHKNHEKGDFKCYGKSKTLGSEWHGKAECISSFNLYPNARYTIEEVGINQYRLVFDSIIEHKNDYYRLGIPGFMVYSTR